MAHVFQGDAERLDNPQRRKLLPPDAILNQLGIRPGDTIIDFGCGVGYFTIPALELVGENGKVIAIDISKKMLDELRKRAGARKNLEIMRSNNTDKAPDNVDFIFLITVLHELEGPEKFLEKCFAKLNENGRLIIIDWQKRETEFGPPLEHRIAKEEVLAMSGKRHIEHDINENFYFLEFFD